MEKPVISLLPPFASLGGHGGEILWISPHPHVSLHFVPLLFFPFLCSYHNGSFHFFCFLIWIFTLLLLKVSPLFPHPCSLCVLSLLFFMLPASSTIHPDCCPLPELASKSPLLAAALDSSLSSLSPFNSKALPPAESSFDSDNCTRNGKQ